MKLSDFRKACHDFYDRPRPKERQLVIYTRRGGMLEFDYTMRKEVIVQILETKTNITSEQRTRLREMINSPDRENLTVVELIIQNL